MRPHRVLVLDVLTKHPPQMPFVDDLPPKNRTEHRVRESVQVREKGERDEQAEAVRS